MDDDRAVEIILEVLYDEVDVFEGGLEQVDGCDSVELFPGLLEVEVERDVVFAEVLHLEEGGVDLPVEIVENEDLPQVLPLSVDLPQQLLLLPYQVHPFLQYHHVYNKGSESISACESLHVFVYVVLVGAEELVLFAFVALLVEFALLGVVQPGSLGLLALHGLLVGLVVEQSLVVPFHVHCQLVHHRPSLVEAVAIGPNLLDVGVELGGGGVDGVVEVGLDGGEVHGFLDDVEVVDHSVALGVDRY